MIEPKPLDDATAQRQRPLIIYHSNCMDGFTAAWAAWLTYPSAEFYPGVHGQPPPDVTGRTVYLLDFSYKFGIMLDLYHAADGIIVLDHHKSAEAELAPMFADGWLGGRFDLSKSGARLAWEWFHPGIEVPFFVRLVEDRDLWQFSIPNSKELNALFFSYEYSFDTWSRLRWDVEDGKDALIEMGAAIERKHMKDVRELVEKTRHERRFTQFGFGEASFPCANLPYTMSSDAGNLMAEGVPFAATYYFDGEQYVFSLRSREGGADVSKIAVLYGGGGHEHAAGFRVRSLEEL